MADQDLLFSSHGVVFSFRVGGVLLREGRVLLQHIEGQPDYAVPGGHVNFLESSEEALVREFAEEIGVTVKPARMLWLGENFFPWEEKFCHQLSFYFLVELTGEVKIPLEGRFFGLEKPGSGAPRVEFCWFSIEELKDLKVYPTQLQEGLAHLPDHTERFVFIEK